MVEADSPEAIREAATRLLARREHATAELQRKLHARGFDAEAVAAVLAELARERLLNDERYVESYVHMRAQRGFGPVRIRAELKERGVDDALIDDHVDFTDSAWLDVVRRVAVKRFGPAPPEDFGQRARRYRFLQYRGFTQQQIDQLWQGKNEQ